MGPLHRLRVEVARRQLHRGPLERGDRLRPQRLHGVDVLGTAAGTGAEVHLQVLELLPQPADADAEVHPAAGEVIQVRHQLGGIDRLALRHQADAGAEADAGRVRGGEGECAEGIQQAIRLARDAPIVRVGIRGFVVREEQHVFRRPHGREAHVLKMAGGAGDVVHGRAMAERNGDAYFHAQVLLSGWAGIAGRFIGRAAPPSV